jgi:hypothetical protein
MEKICVKCETKKPFKEFTKNKNTKDGYFIYCKDCEKIRRKKYKESQNITNKKWRINNPEKQKESQRKYIETNPEMKSSVRLKKYRENEVFREKEKISQKQYYEKNIIHERERRREFYITNKKNERIYNNEWKRNKMKSDPFFRMKKNLRDRIRLYLKGELSSKRTKDIVGINMVEFREYIESKFIDGMSWENYGTWHLDHKKPLVLGTNNEEILELNYYTNLQPLWADDNIRKNRKYGN